MSMYVRVKRHLITYFIHCEPTETLLDIKKRIEARSTQPVDKLKLVLLPSNIELNDSQTIAQQKIENDAVLGLTYQLESGEWEDLRIDVPSGHPSADIENV